MSELFVIIQELIPLEAISQRWPGLVLLGALGFGLGFALNQGSTCTVIATAELISQKRPVRLIAFLECAIWAGIVYAILDVSPAMPNGWSPLGYLIPAAMIFAVGTYINGACVFGSVGHLGNGDINFGFTFVGIIVALYIESALNLVPKWPSMNTNVSPGPILLTLALVAVMTLRLALSRGATATFLRQTMSMGLVGVIFTVLVNLAPQFSITMSLGTIVSLPIEGAVVCVSMFGGSLFSARARNRGTRLKWPTIRGVGRRMLGGGLMGLSALLIPGGNDTLLMVGFPMWAWQAGLAYLVLIVSLAAMIIKFGSAARSWS